MEELYLAVSSEVESRGTGICTKQVEEVKGIVKEELDQFSLEDN